jgi:hypothetical protein
VSTSNAANKPNALALDCRFPPMEPTLGRRIHFVYSTGICGCLSSTLHGLTTTVHKLSDDRR